MKKAMVKRGLRVFSAVFILFGTLLLTATRADAQGLDDMQGQNLNWVSEAEAMVVLEAQMELLGNDLAVLTPGTPTYNDILNHFTYYKLIYSELEDGQTTTKLATDKNLLNVSMANGSQDTAPIPVNLNQLYSDAVALLTN
ncbi:MAG: hypothetical protein EP344_15825 [Bacteroidetes bacterium]|nr:MAG: hypothetical protein EP344_15825 [Bacteroidota bacterium]